MRSRTTYNVSGPFAGGNPSIVSTSDAISRETSASRAGSCCLAASIVWYRPIECVMASSDNRIWGVSCHAARSWGTDQWRAKRRWPSQHNTSQPRHQRGILMANAASGLKVCPRLSHEGSGQRTRRLTTCVGPSNVQR